MLLVVLVLLLVLFLLFLLCLSRFCTSIGLLAADSWTRSSRIVARTSPGVPVAIAASVFVLPTSVFVLPTSVLLLPTTVFLLPTTGIFRFHRLLCRRIAARAF